MTDFEIRDEPYDGPSGGRLIAAVQDILVYAHWPDWRSLVPVSVLSLLLCAWGWRLFRRHSGELVDEL